MAANINPDLSTMAASSAVPSEEGTPIVHVSKSGNGVMLKWGGNETHEVHKSEYNIAPYNILATNKTGQEPIFKTFGSLLGCDDGEMTINKTTYRIQVHRQEGPTIGVPPEQTNGLLTPESTQNRQNPISPGKMIDDADPSAILQTVMHLCNSKNYFHKTTVPSSPFQRPNLGAFTKTMLGHTAAEIDMRFGADPSPVGEELRNHFKSGSQKHLILLAKSGTGKTTAIFDAARQHWCILFTASSSYEGMVKRGDPGGWDSSFASLVDYVVTVLNRKKPKIDQKSICDRLMKVLVISRLVVLKHFQTLTDATPEAWLIYQLTPNMHDSTTSIFFLLKNRKDEALLVLQQQLRETLMLSFFAFDEAQYGYELLAEDQNIWYSTRNKKIIRGIACPFIRMLKTFRKPVVLAGTALSLQSAESCKSDLGKAESCVVLTDFPPLCLAEIEQKLGTLVNLDGLDLKETNLWKLEGRGRLFGGLLLSLAGFISEGGSKLDILNRAIEKHYNSVLEGLKKRIKEAYPPQSDPLLKEASLPRSLEMLGIAALWGGTVALASKDFNIDLLHVGLCSIEKSSKEGGELYVLSEELGRQAILEVAQGASVVGDSFSRMLNLCKPAAGHAMEPLLVAELAMWCKKNPGATVKCFISTLFNNVDVPSDLPDWVNHSMFNVKKGCNKANRIAASCSNDIEFISKAAKEVKYRDTLLSPTTTKRPDFEAVMGQKGPCWFLAASSKLYGKSFDDSNGNDLRSTQPSKFYCKKDGTENGNCYHLKRDWDKFCSDEIDLFKNCLRIHCCIPDVKPNNKIGNKRLWVESDGSIVLYITANNIRRLFQKDTIDILKQYGYIPDKDLTVCS